MIYLVSGKETQIKECHKKISCSIALIIYVARAVNNFSEVDENVKGRLLNIIKDLRLLDDFRYWKVHFHYRHDF